MRDRPSSGHEWKGGVITFVAFVIAGLLPLIPFFIADPQNMLQYSIVATAIAFFVVGMSRVIITHRNWFISGLEMLVVGGIAAAVSYAVGLLVSLFV